MSVVTVTDPTVVRVDGEPARTFVNVGVQGPPGVDSMIPGGSAGQALVKQSAANFDVDWAEVVDVSARAAAGAAQGDADAAQAAADAAQGDVDAHAARTDNPHAVTAAQAGADPAGTAASAVAAHASVTAGVHGIADASALVVTTDPRLADARGPTAHAGSHATTGSDPLTPTAIGAATVAAVEAAQATADAAIPTSEKGEPAGVATLDAGGRLVLTQRPIVGLWLPGTSGDRAIAQNTADLDGSGALDLRVKCSPVVETSGSAGRALISRSDTGVRSWEFRLSRTTANLARLWLAMYYDGGTAVGVASSTEFSSDIYNTPGGVWFRVTREIGEVTDDVTFYYSTDDGATWAAISTQNRTKRAWNAGNTRLEVGTRLAGANDRFLGTIYRAQVRTSIDGAPVADFDPSRHPATPAAWVGADGRMWQMMGSAWEYRDSAGNTVATAADARRYMHSGRVQPTTAGKLMPWPLINHSGQVWPGLSWLTYCCVYTPRRVRVTSMEMHVTTARAGTRLHMAIYDNRDDGNGMSELNLSPGVRLVEFGSAATDTTGLKVINAPSDVFLEPGFYHLAAYMVNDIDSQLISVMSYPATLSPYGHSHVANIFGTSRKGVSWVGSGVPLYFPGGPIDLLGSMLTNLPLIVANVTAA